MKIAYISDVSPLDIHVWSGTTYHVFKKLSEKHTVIWLGEGICNGAYWHHHFLHNGKPFYVHDYSPNICSALSESIKSGKYDVVVTSVYAMMSDLDVDVPVIYYSDIIYALCKDNYFSMTDEYEKRAILREGKALKRADRIIFSSELVRKTAIEFYGVSKDKIHVLDFGANIPEPANVIPDIYEKDICHLTFVGRDWKRKGGDKMLQIFRILKDQGFVCDLTIIGSKPIYDVNERNITIIPFLDKGKDEDLKKYDKILRKSHFMVLPTNYDAYGIIFCEASAYGIPSIAANVGGVGQPVKDGINGFLMPKDATAEEYAVKIREVYENKDLYTEMRKSSRREYEMRLNWKNWGEKVNLIINEAVAEYRNRPKSKNSEINGSKFCLPVYAINLKQRTDRLANLKKQFESKSEFVVTYIDAVEHDIGAIGLWKSICKAVKLAQNRGEDVIALCEDDHEFTEIYDKEVFLANIVGAYRQEAELLNAGVGGFGTAVPISPSRCWVDWFWCTQFVVIFAPLFSKIIAYDFSDTDTADGVLSRLSSNSQIMYPPFSRQKDFGYSDITQREMQSQFQNNIFSTTNHRLKVITDVYRHYHNPIKNKTPNNNE